MPGQTGKKLSKADWAEMKIEFITNSTLKLDDISTKWGISDSYVRQIAAKEAWIEQQECFLKKSTDDRLEKQRKLDVEKFDCRNRRQQELAELLLNDIEIDVLNKTYDKNKATTYKLYMEAISKGQDIERKCFGADVKTNEVSDININVKLPKRDDDD